MFSSEEHSLQPPSESYKLVNIPPEYFVNNDDIKSIVPALRQIADFTSLSKPSTQTDFAHLDGMVLRYTPGAIPVLLDRKAESLIEQLTEERNKFKRQKVIDRKQLKLNGSNDGKAGENDEDVDALKHIQGAKGGHVEENRFLDLQRFSSRLRSNLNEQILSLSILNFPNYTKNTIDKFLNFVIQENLVSEFKKQDAFASKKDWEIAYQWSTSNYDNSENKVLYVKFEIKPPFPSSSAKTKPIINEGFINLNVDQEFKFAFIKHVFYKFIKIIANLKLLHSFKDEYNRNRMSDTVLAVTYEQNTEKLLKLVNSKVTIEELQQKHVQDTENKDAKLAEKSSKQESQVVSMKDDNEMISKNGEADNADKSSPTESGEKGDIEMTVEEEFADLKSLKAASTELASGLIKTDQKDKEKDNDDDSAENYKVNLKELSDLPKKMVPQIVEDIKDFRLSIIRLEKKKQAKKVMEEKRRAKQQIKKMYMSIKESKKKKGTKPGGHEEMDVDDEDYEDEDDEDEDIEEDISDQEYENIREDEQQEKIEREYLRQESQIKYIEQHAKQKLLKRLNELQEYQSKLKTEQQSYLDDYESLFGEGSEISSDTKTFDPSKLNHVNLFKLVNLYNSNRASYLQMRNAEKIQEEKLDEENRKAELQYKAAEQQSVAFLSSLLGPGAASSSNASDAAGVTRDEVKQPFKLTMKPTSGAASKSKKAASGDLYSLDDEALAAVVDNCVSFINGLIEEYLGMLEEDLSNYIATSLKARKPRDDITQELKETFDEDAEEITQKLWAKLDEKMANI